MINPDIDFYQTEDGMPIRTEYVDNSKKDYKLKMVIGEFRLTTIRKYIFGVVYIWRRISK